jgi:hypothetical protein
MISRQASFHSSQLLAVRRLESWEAGRLEGSKTSELPGFLASQLPSPKPFDNSRLYTLCKVNSLARDVGEILTFE